MVQVLVSLICKPEFAHHSTEITEAQAQRQRRSTSGKTNFRDGIRVYVVYDSYEYYEYSDRLKIVASYSYHYIV